MFCGVVAMPCAVGAHSCVPWSGSAFLEWLTWLDVQWLAVAGSGWQWLALVGIDWYWLALVGKWLPVGPKNGKVRWGDPASQFADSLCRRAICRNKRRY